MSTAAHRDEPIKVKRGLAAVILRWAIIVFAVASFLSTLAWILGATAFAFHISMVVFKAVLTVFLTGLKFGLLFAPVLLPVMLLGGAVWYISRRRKR